MRSSSDSDAKATYIEWSEGVVDRTVSVTDLVMVDVNALGDPVGVEFAVPVDAITTKMIGALREQFPVLEDLCDRVLQWATID